MNLIIHLSGDSVDEVVYLLVLETDVERGRVLSGESVEGSILSRSEGRTLSGRL